MSVSKRFLLVAAFFMLFPFVYLYNAAFVLFGFGGGLGGGGAVAALSSFVLILLFFALDSAGFKRNGFYIIINFLFFSFLVSVFVVFSLGYLFREAVASYVLEYFYLFLLWFVFFFLGHFWGRESYKNIFPFLWFCCFLIFSIFVFIAYDPMQGRISYRVGNVGGSSYVTHHFYSIATIVVVWLILRKCGENTKLIFLMPALCAVVVFFTGTRGDLIAILLSSKILFFVYVIRKNSLKVNFFNGLLFVLVLSFGVWVLFFYDDAVYGLFERLSSAISGESSSAQERQKLTQYALLDIFESPFLGEIGGQVKYGGFGYYSHNILSVWRQFGLFSFLLFVLTSLIGLWVFFVSFFKNKPGSFADLWFAWIVIFLAFFVKSVFWPYAILVWGLASGVSRSCSKIWGREE